MWDCPNSIESLDGKHSHIKAPPNSGSEFFQRKKPYIIFIVIFFNAIFYWWMLKILVGTVMGRLATQELDDILDFKVTMSVETDFNKKLIDLVSQHELVYNHRHSEHKNRPKVDRIWKNIAAELNSTADRCRTRWRTLTTAYGKKHKRAKEIPNGSAALAPVTWPYYRQLSFLEPVIKHRKSIENFTPASESQVAESEDVQNDDIGSLSSFPQQLPSPLFAAELFPPSGTGSYKRARTESQQVQTELLGFIQNTSKQLDEMREKREDRLDIFGKFVAAEIRAKPEALRNSYIREISNLLFSDVEIEVQCRRQKSTSGRAED